MQMRIVLDTASFVAAIRSRRGAANALFKRIFNGSLTVVMDYKLLLEYRDVALRTEHIQASYLSEREVHELIELVAGFAEPIEDVALLRPLSPDPGDDMILELAVAASVDAIVTNNTRHFLSAAQTFGILTLTPGELIARLEGSHDDSRA